MLKMGGGGVCCNIFNIFNCFLCSKKQQRKIPSVLYLKFSVTFLVLDLGQDFVPDFVTDFVPDFVTDFVPGTVKSLKILQGKITVVEDFFDQFFSFSVHSFINLSTMFFILIGGLHICSTYKRHTHMSGHHTYLLSHHAKKLENVFIENFPQKQKKLFQLFSPFLTL